MHEYKTKLTVIDTEICKHIISREILEKFPNNNVSNRKTNIRTLLVDKKNKCAIEN